jgi:CheY-like chemotaxis protein
MMPNMDGPELVKRLREERKTKFLPVIFVTASDDGMCNLLVVVVN